jgi:hypothetical protein
MSEEVTMREFINGKGGSELFLQTARYHEVDPTTRQASKWRRNKGILRKLASTNFHEEEREALVRDLLNMKNIQESKSKGRRK